MLKTFLDLNFLVSKYCCGLAHPVKSVCYFSVWQDQLRYVISPMAAFFWEQFICSMQNKCFFWKLFFQNRKLFFVQKKFSETGFPKIRILRFFFGWKNISDFEKKMFFHEFFIFHRTYALGFLHLEYELITPKTRKVTSEKLKNCVYFFILDRSDDENRENTLTLF